MKKKSFISAFIGNILEHYDTALYALLAPYFAPLFFPTQDPITALIYAYAFVPLGVICRPLGALVFGSIGDRLGRKRALSLSLLGTAFATVLMGGIPVGTFLSPWLLCMSRLLQGFFSAAEAPGGAIFILEKTSSSHKNLLSGLYDGSTIFGVLLATLFVFALGKFGDLHLLWRIPFFVSAVTALIGLWIRRIDDGEVITPVPMKTYIKTVWQGRSMLLPFIFCSGFCYATYSFAFPFMSSYFPIASDMSFDHALKLQNLFLLLELILLPLFGFLSSFFKKEKWMGFMALSLAVVTPFLFTTPILLQAVIVVFGAAFGAVYYAWAEERSPPAIRYSLVAFGGTLGKQLLGVPSIVIGLWLYQKTGWIWAPGIYLSFLALTAIISLYKRPLGQSKLEEA